MIAGALALITSVLLLMDARGQSLVLAGPGLSNGGSGGCVLWDPSQAAPQANYIFDPSTFTYSGSNFSSGTNGGLAGGAWTVESGTPAKGTALNGRATIGFTGAQGFINTSATWPAGNVYVFTVSNIGATHIGALVSAAWGVADGRDASHDWVFYPRGGSAFGGSANEGWIFQGTGAAVVTRGDLFTDSSYHIATIKLGTSSDLRLDGTAGTPTAAAGTINTSSAAKIRVGASGPSASEALTGTVAYLVVLIDPTIDTIQKLEGWAAAPAQFNMQANLPGGHPYKSSPPCVGGVIPPPPPCSVSPCDPPPLTWTQIQNDNGTLATRQPVNVGGNGYGTQHDNGIYPYNIPLSYSWYYGGDEYLGDPVRPVDVACPRQKGFTCTAMTAWHLVEHEAVSAGGVAKPSLPSVNVIYRNYQSWCHFVAGGWFLAQNTNVGGGMNVVTGMFFSAGEQTPPGGTGITTTRLGDGTSLNAQPQLGGANHGWPSSRGGFTAGTVDHCYMQYEVRADQPNANLLAASGIDWWFNTGADFPANTGYSQSIWVRITPDWTRVTGTSMGLAALQADPPPPLVGIGP